MKTTRNAKRIAAFALLPAMVFVLLCSCAKKDVRMKQSAVEEAVRSAVFPEVTLLSESGEGELKSYTFLFNKIDGSFEVISYVYTEKDESGKERDVEELLIYYERDLMALPQYVSERKALAERYGISESFADDSHATIKAGGYKDLDKLAEYIAALDALYAFTENQPDKCVHINSGTISFPNTSIQGPEFSHTPSERLTKDAVRQTLLTEYILMLKRFGLTDPEMPAEVFDSVSL